MITLPIHDIAFGGKGVGRSEGMVVFVPFTIPGESVKVALTKKKKNFAEGQLLSVEVASPDRVEPPCPYFGQCGGCSYQHIRYERQLEIKTRQVEETLRRVGKLKEVPIQPTLPSPKPYGYRNRIRVHVEGGATGFYRMGSNRLIEIEECLIAAPAVNQHLKELRKKRLPEGDYTVSAKQQRFFEQTNPEVAREMVQVVEGLLSPGGRLIDAYCGAGFFARHFKDRYSEVVGIEENVYAVEQARREASPHEVYYAGDVAALLPDLLAEEKETTLLLDPPAAGVNPRVLDAILAYVPREILYVSCNPATLARDLAGLQSAYTVTHVQPLDMFPQTAEIEVVVHLKKH